MNWKLLNSVYEPNLSYQPPLQNEAVNDFKKRIAHYEDQYQTLDETLEPDLSFLKIFNCGKKVSVYQHEGHIQSRIVYFLMNLHLQVGHAGGSLQELYQNLGSPSQKN